MPVSDGYLAAAGLRLLAGRDLADLVTAAEIAEEMNHHPDMDIRWRTVTFSLATHSAGGVTQLDVELAHRIDGVTASLDS